ncbi:MAG: response regulator [Ferruginibacter sp.]
MAKTGPIIVVEDDEDDVLFLTDTLNQQAVPNKLIWFSNAAEALDYLLNTQDKPFFILCDVNLPLRNGLEFKRDLDTDPFLRKKSIPFIFYSTSVEQRFIDAAYSEMSVQGFFQKGYDFKEIFTAIKIIMDYWALCKHPNS